MGRSPPARLPAEYECARRGPATRWENGRGGGNAPKPAPPPPPVTTSYASTTTSNPSLYYFKAVDSTVSSVKTSSQSSTAYSAGGVDSDNDNLALPGGYQPTYVVYPTTSSPGPNPTQSYSSQKYLKPNKKPTFRPAGSYDAPKSPSKTSSQSIYRDDTSKFHPASLVHLPKVMWFAFFRFEITTTLDDNPWQATKIDKLDKFFFSVKWRCDQKHTEKSQKGWNIRRVFFTFF